MVCPSVRCWVGASCKPPLAPEKGYFLLQLGHLMFYLPPHSLGVGRTKNTLSLEIEYGGFVHCYLHIKRRAGLIECLVNVPIKTRYQIPSGQGVAVPVKPEEGVDRELRVSTLCAELQFYTALLRRLPSSLCSTWFLGAVLIALNSLPKGAWLANPIVKYLHCPPSSSSELLQVWCLVA